MNRLGDKIRELTSSLNDIADIIDIVDSRISTLEKEKNEDELMMRALSEIIENRYRR